MSLQTDTFEKSINKPLFRSITYHISFYWLVKMIDIGERFDECYLHQYTLLDIELATTKELLLV